MTNKLATGLQAMIKDSKEKKIHEPTDVTRERREFIINMKQLVYFAADGKQSWIKVNSAAGSYSSKMKQELEKKVEGVKPLSQESHKPSEGSKLSKPST